jgi:hypothetical protein
MSSEDRDAKGRGIYSSYLTVSFQAIILAVASVLSQDQYILCLLVWLKCQVIREPLTDRNG